MTVYSELLGVFPTDLSTPKAPTPWAVLSVISGYSDAGVLASVLRNRFRQASLEYLTGVISSLHNRGAIEIEATGRINRGNPVVRIRIAKAAVDVLEPMSGLRGRITKALSDGGPQPLSAIVNRLRPTTEKAIYEELRAMYRDGLILAHPPKGYIYPAEKGKRARRSSKMVFELVK